MAALLAALLALAAGCATSSTAGVEGALAKGDVRGALLAYERGEHEDRAALAAIARAVLRAALRDPELAVRQ